MNTNQDSAQEVVLSFKKAKRVLIGVQFGAGALVISGFLTGYVGGHTFWGPFIGQAAPWMGVGLMVANIAYGLTLGLWGKCPPAPVR